jgi:hypothetical protein
MQKTRNKYLYILGFVVLMIASLSDSEKKAKIDALIKSNKDASVIYDDSILKYIKDLKARMEKSL